MNPGARADRHLRVARGDVQLAPQLPEPLGARPLALHPLHVLLDRVLLPLLPRALLALLLERLGPH